MRPGMYSRPAEPIPQGRPRLAPFLVVQTGPFGPSVTNGIRSLHSAGALVTKRSGGIQQRSMWQSAEIISYRIGEPPPDERVGPAQSYQTACATVGPSPASVVRR